MSHDSCIVPDMRLTAHLYEVLICCYSKYRQSSVICFLRHHCRYRGCWCRNLSGEKKVSVYVIVIIKSTKTQSQETKICEEGGNRLDWRLTLASNHWVLASSFIVYAPRSSNSFRLVRAHYITFVAWAVIGDQLHIALDFHAATAMTNVVLEFGYVLT